MSYDLGMIAEEAAAQLFWNLAAKQGVSATSDLVIETEGSVLLKQPFLEAALSLAGIHTAPITERNTLLKMIPETAFKQTVKNQNILGALYLDEVYQGNTTQSEEMLASSVFADLKKATPRLSSDTDIYKYGALSLRTPLPAVVLIEKQVQDVILVITDVLGFDYPIFFHNQGYQLVDDGLYIGNGTFAIPVRNKQEGELWAKLIPNSQPFIRGHTFYSGSRKCCISTL